MKQFEKVLFLDLTNYQLGKSMYDENFLVEYGKLSKDEKAEHTKLHNDIHSIWSYINSPFLNGVNRPMIKSVMEYHENVWVVDERILQLCQDFDITLNQDSTPTSDRFKEAVRQYLGL